MNYSSIDTIDEYANVELERDRYCRFTGDVKIFDYLIQIIQFEE